MSIDLLERYVGFACAATLFVCGAGDGNRTRTVSLGTNLMRAIHRGGPLDCAGRGHPLEPAIDRESPAVWARRGHGASNLLKRGEGVISWWQPLATTVAAELALLSSLRSADPATFDTQLRA